MSDMDISIVIPTKDGERYIDSALKAIFSQKTNYKFEVIIIDSGSKDKTLAIIKMYPVRLYQIKEETFNHGLTRNFGISKAQGKYVILMTQDAIPYDKYWMERLANNFKHDDSIAGVYSRQVSHKDSSVLTRIRVIRSFTSREQKMSRQIADIENYNKLLPQEKYDFCNFDNVSSCIKKAVWERFQFPKTEFGEDVEWAKCVLEAGYKIIYDPNSIVYHSHDYSIPAWYERNRINYNKLHIIFGLNGADKFYKLPIAAFLYAARDFYSLIKLCKDKKDIKPIFSNTCAVYFYSFIEAFGQYMGIKKSRY